MTGLLPVRLADGPVIHVPEALTSMTGYVLREQGDWFEDEIRFLRRIVPRGAVAIDIGANFGVYTLTFAAAAGGEGAVIAFEPSASTAAALQSSVDANRFTQVCVVRAAVSDRTGRATLSVYDSPELNTVGAAADGAKPVGVEEVDVVALDTFEATRERADVGFLKLDAEGEEARIVAGGEAFLVRNSPLVMFEIRHGDRWNVALVEALTSRGFGIYRLLPGPSVLAPVERLDGLCPATLNLFACRADRAAVMEAAGVLAASVREADARPSMDLERVVSLHAAAHDARRAPRDRVAVLDTARAWAEAACAAAPTPGRRSTLARLQWESGLRQAAVATLGTLVQTLSKASSVRLDEPMLAPCERFDVLPRSSDRDWLLAAALEQYELLRGYSSFFTGPSSLPLLEGIDKLGYGAPHLTRRRTVVLQRMGKA